MDTSSILASIAAEVARLQQGRAALTGNAAKAALAPRKTTKRRKMSKEGRGQLWLLNASVGAAAKDKK